MHSRDRLLALLVAVCWGLNFPATALALQHFPPLFLVALRFALSPSRRSCWSRARR